jgi:hypothetical protein
MEVTEVDEGDDCEDHGHRDSVDNEGVRKRGYCHSHTHGGATESPADETVSDRSCYVLLVDAVFLVRTSMLRLLGHGFSTQSDHAWHAAGVFHLF